MTKLDIINMALDNAGLPRAASGNDVNWNADSIFDNAVSDILRSFPWNFCQQFAVLTANAQKPVAGYENSYNMPADCLRVINIRQDKDLRAPAARYSLVGRTIYTNASPCYLQYVQKKLDPNDWTPDFANCVAICIASRIATSTAQNPELSLRLYQQYKATLAEAQAIDARESREQIPVDTTFLQARMQVREGGNGGAGQ